MEPHREEQPKAPPTGAEQKRKRFRIVKLEERIAPSNSGGGSKNCYNHVKATAGGVGCATGGICTVGCAPNTDGVMTCYSPCL
jgi:hypothetical protein